MKVVTFIHDSIVIKNLRETTLQAYPNHHHLYNLHLKDVRTHLVRIVVCLILMVTKFSYATIQHRLRWDLYMWMDYVCESLYHVSQASTSSFYTALKTQSENHDAAYTPQAYDSDNIF